MTDGETMLIDQLTAIEETLEPISLDMGSDELSLMRTLVDEGNFKGIYDLALELAEKQIFDVRILIYGVYHETTEDKIATLSNFYQTVNVLLTTAWHAVGPEGKRETYAKTSFSWLFKQNLIDFQTQEVEQGALWQSWLSTYTPLDIEQLISDSESTRGALQDTLGEAAGGSLEKITELNNWFRTFIKLLPVPQEEAPVEDMTSEEAPKDDSNTGTSGALGTTGSVHLDLLFQKMKVFERVTQKGDIFKAAIVLADINAELESFDPKVYFPDVFSQFYLTLVQNINPITEVMEMQDSPQWTVLNQLYQVDKNRFIDVEV